MSSRIVGAAAAVALLSAVPSMADEIRGAEAPLGGGAVQSYARTGADGAPAEIGVIFSAGALDGLPAEHNPESHCFDVNGDGQVSLDGECLGDYGIDLALPEALTAREDVTFDFVMVNWEPHGHPPEAWALPHFDIHFYSVPITVVDAMRTGPCGFLMNCEDFARATRPVPAQYLHPDHASVGAAVPRMGDHLVDTKTPELGDPPQTFTHTFIYGAWDAQVIFHEVMATRAFMAETGGFCQAIKQPAAWERAGYYPTRYCFRRGADDGSLRVFMSDFTQRPAT